MNEEWRPIPGYEGSYEVSSLGRVRSIDRTIEQTRQGKTRLIKLRGKILSQVKRDGRYWGVTLRRNGEGFHHRVHGLVAEAFLGPRPDGMDILHGPNGPLDNSVGNLRYGTESENMKDKQRDGTDYQRNKTHCPRGHKLEEPNLKTWNKANGTRVCKACNRAHGHISVYNKLGLPIADLQTLSDLKYEKIVEAA